MSEFGDLSSSTVRFLEAKAGAGIWSYDVAADTFVWSAGMFKLFGMEPGDQSASGNLLNALAHPQDRLTRSDFEGILERGLPFERELRIIQPTGRLRWLLNRGDVILDRAGNPKMAVAVSLDTTVIHEREQAHSLPYVQLRNFITAIAPIIWSARPDGSLISILGASDLFVAKEADIQPVAWFAGVHEDDVAQVQRLWGEATRNLALFDVEHRLRRAAGGKEWFRTTARPVFDEKGDVKHWNGLCVMLDKRLPQRGRASDLKLLAASQIRAARAILRWSVSDLSERSAVSPAIIRRLEESDAHAARDEAHLEKIRTIMQDAGVEFVTLTDGEPATRARKSGRLKP